MKQNKKSLLAYAGGIIDGEGCIHFAQKHYEDPDRIFFTPRITCGMINAKAIDLLYGLFGGSIRIANDGGHIRFFWEVSCEKARDTAKQLEPFLRLKKEQAQLLIRMQDRIRMGKKNNLGKGWQNQSLSQHELDKRKELAKRMSYLNSGVIVPPRAALTTKQIKRCQDLLGKDIVSDSLTKQEL